MTNPLQEVINKVVKTTVGWIQEWDEEDRECEHGINCAIDEVIDNTEGGELIWAARDKMQCDDILSLVQDELKK